MTKFPWARAIGAGVVLVLGSLAMYGALTWDIREAYTVNLNGFGGSTLAGVNWTIWLPAPDRTMTIASNGSGMLVGEIVTPHGRMLNFTGSGLGSLQLLWSSSAVGPDPLSFGVPGPLTAANETNAWVFVAITPATTVTSIIGVVSWGAVGFQGFVNGQGQTFYGFLVNGWNQVKGAPGPVTIRLGDPPLPGIAGFLIACGAGSVAWIVYRYRRPPDFA